MEKAYIYLKQLKYTGKFYIGKHNGRKGLNYKGSGTEWRKDCEKFVKSHQQDIITEILEYVDDISKLNEREEYWLNKYKAAQNPLFYNKTNNCYGLENFTQEHKDKISKKLKGREFNGDWKNKISNKLKNNKNHQMPHSEETKNKISKSRTGFKCSDETKRKFSESKIGNSCRKGKKLNEEQRIRKSQSHMKKVVQKDKNGNILKIWNSQEEAEKKLNIRGHAVSACCLKKQKTAGGFIWEFYNTKILLKD